MIHIATGANLAKMVFYFRKKIQKTLIPRLLPFYVVKITQKSKQNEPGQNAQDSLVFSKLRYCEFIDFWYGIHQWGLSFFW